MTSCDNTHGLLSVEDALALLLDKAQAPKNFSNKSLLDSLGTIVARQIQSPIQVPGHDNSAMDGYAFKHADYQGNALPVSARIPAGTIPDTLKEGTAARIFTGAPVPPGADTVVMQENTSTDSSGLTITTLPKPGANIRPAGNDVAQNDRIAHKGQLITPALIGLLSGCGLHEVPVFNKLKVAIFSTGDELVTPGTALKPGQIYNSNRYTMSSLLQTMGCEVVDLGQVEDKLNATRNALVRASQSADLIMTSGGVSVGEEDHVRAALEAEGSLDAWRVRLKPGKPVVIGHVNNTPFLGLPGNPVAVWVTFLMFAAPFIRKSQGTRIPVIPFQPVIADFTVTSKGRQEMLRVQIQNRQGVLTAIRYPRQGSDVLSGAAWADGLARLLPGQTIQKGETIDYAKWQDFLT